jgi:OPA family glycerol-3-phosphate transporter-like MFS transporter
LIVADLHAAGATIAEATLRVGELASIGTLVYAGGKFFLSWLGDFLGGKRTFLLGMLGAVVSTVLFAVGGSFGALLVTWSANRLSQSIGWPGLAKVTVNWFSYRSYGSVMAVLSLSFLAGDALTRAGVSALIGAGFGWRSIFLVTAAVLAVIAIVDAMFLGKSRTDAGFSAAEVRPDNAFGPEGANDRAHSLPELLAPLLQSPAFLLVCALSFGTTLLREALGLWATTYLVTFAGLAPAQAAGFSATVPAAGVVSVLVAGMWSDRLGPTGRARIAFAGLSLAVLALCAVGVLAKGAAVAAVTLLALVALFNTGPYSYLAGAMALDLGARKGSASAAGVIDGVGYVGGALSGLGIAGLELRFGWAATFFALAALTAVTAGFAAALLRLLRATT